VWDQQYDFQGKRVALVGSGSTAIQILPQIAPIAQQVDQYVRSATWIGFPFAAEEIQSLHEGETPGTVNRECFPLVSGR
jgi:cation diffusion facilitator CzcD-associated flavoprotein CzcO